MVKASKHCIGLKVSDNNIIFTIYQVASSLCDQIE